MLSEQKKSLSGPEKVAILMRLLDEDSLNSILPKFDENEIKQISKALMSLGQVPSEIVENVLFEFLWRVNESFNVVGNKNLVLDMLQKSLGSEKANRIIDEVENHNRVSVWDHLEKMSRQDLMIFLKKEHPQTIAAILSIISSPKAAAVLSVMDKEYSFEIVKRILSMEKLSSQSIKHLEKALHKQFTEKFIVEQTRTKSNIQVIADILDTLNANDNSTINSENFLNKIEIYDKNAADNIKKMMFSFSDIAKLDYPSIQTILANLQNKNDLIIALKGSNENIRRVFANAMSQRAAKLLLEEVTTLSNTNASEIMRAQRTITDQTKKLLDSGHIVLKDNILKDNN
ncbi:flagellar motor switch protein FliG [Lyticum sinuosum]|uniref:Flagellar motor switch protein FliG n=1 Tax=Lyticum sinuosum TaxID=1332059 RepID=A0AAE4VK63_9RICK|nr:FliG C-terminal domain-containing protein [Lyticum sinuosum]MDZ5761292.1 Flagellar motor switch protein FliG [Lyticum sinuosum]